MLTKDFDSLENFGVDAEEVWQIIKNNIPELMIFIQNKLK